MISLYVFSGSFGFLGASSDQCSEMTFGWVHILRTHCWSVPVPNKTWCTTGGDDNSHWQVRVVDSSLPRAQQAVGFKVLVLRMTFDKCFEEELQNRISSAWPASHNCKTPAMLQCRTNEGPLSPPWNVGAIIVVLVFGQLETDGPTSEQAASNSAINAGTTLL